MTDHPFHITIKATDPRGKVTYTTKGGDTLEEARHAAVRWGVAYYLYDNGHITGDKKAFIAASEANKLRDGGDRLEYDGFVFELMDAPELAGV